MNLFYTKKKFLDAIAKGDAKTVAAYLAVSKSWAQTQDDKTKDYALHYAARHSDAGIARQLIEAGATLWCGNGSGQTPLHYATTNGSIDVVKMLLEAGADRYINSNDSSRLSPLHCAILTGKTDILKIFLDTRKADLNTAERPALYYAAECGQKECVRMLLAAGADPNVLKTETRYEYDNDYDDYYYSRHREPSKTTVLKFSPLNCACAKNQTEIVEDLLKAGAKTLPKEYPVHAAAAFGNIPLVTLLIQHGFDAKAANDAGQTPLHTVLRTQASQEQTDMVLFLLAQGVDKNALDSSNRTALSYAQQFALTDTVKILQDPLPAHILAPVKPSVQPVIVEAIPVPSPAIAPAPAPQDAETWALAGAKSVVHATLYPGLGRRLTEIFNFETRERIAITENFTLKTETMAPHENFDNIGDEALRKAFDEFRRLGGKADEAAVFGNRPMKMKVKPG